MGNIYKFMIFLLLASLARADLGGISSWSESASAAPSVELNGVYRFINLETVALVSQDTTITFTYPNRVSFVTDYGFDAKIAGVSLLAAFIPDSGFDWGGKPSYAVDSFKVSVRGKEVERSLIQGPLKMGDDEGTRAFAFPLNFGVAGPCEVRIEYSYTVEGEGFAALAQEQGDLVGLRYSLAPAQYWAGDVGRIAFRVLLEGGDARDLGRIFPTDFKFLPNGVAWQGRGVTDEFISAGYNGEPLEVSVYFGGPTDLNHEITAVTSDAGVNIRSGPAPTFDVVATVAQGERLYVYGVSADEQFTYDKASDSYWLKCRTLDNVDGYVCAQIKDDYLLDSAMARKRKWAKEHGEE